MRKATPEQKQAAQDRRDRTRQLVKKIAAMSEDQRAEFNQRFYRTVDGHVLSPTNQILLAMQGQASALVGGFNQWKKAGRSVRKGEHGSAIYVPLGAPKLDSESESGAGSDIRFGTATLFGLHQTDEIQAA